MARENLDSRWNIHGIMDASEKVAGEQGAEEKGEKERRKRLSIAVEKQASLDMANETWRP